MRAGIIASGLFIVPPLALTYLGVGWSAGNRMATHLIPDLPLGDPSPHRTIIVALADRIAQGHQIASVAIAGVEAVIDQHTSTWPSAAIARATVPNGTTGDVVVNYTGSDNAPAVAAVYATPGPVEVVGKGAQYGSAAGPAVTVPTAAGGALVAAFGNSRATRNGYVFNGWSGAEADHLTDDPAGGNTFASSAHDVTDGTPHTVSVSHASQLYSGLAVVSYQNTPPRWVRWLSRAWDWLLGGGRRA